MLEGSMDDEQLPGLYCGSALDRQAAKLLNIARGRMYDLVASKQVPSVKIGHSIRVPVKALEAWIDRNTHVRPE